MEEFHQMMDNAKLKYFPINIMKKSLKHPLLVAVVGGVIGAAACILDSISPGNSPPVISLVPSVITVDAAENVTFDAQGSTNIDGNIVHSEWSVNGRKHDETSIASCDDQDKLLQMTCRFAIPGTHVISLSVVDDDDTKAVQSSVVQVKMQGGYIGVVLQYGDKNKDENLQNAFNYGVDWVKVQTLLTGKPIILYDPTEAMPVYATRFTRSVERAREYAKNSKNARSLRVLARLPRDAMNKVLQDLAEVGVNVRFIPIAAEEVFAAMRKGTANSSFVLIDGPDALYKYYKK